MIELIQLLLQGLGAFMLLLIFYIVLFRLYYKHKDNLPWWMYPLALSFVALDWAINMTVMTVFMFDGPKEYLVTARMKRYKQLKPKGWREWLQFKTAHNLCLILNLFDPKGHC